MQKSLQKKSKNLVDFFTNFVTTNFVKIQKKYKNKNKIQIFGPLHFIPPPWSCQQLIEDGGGVCLLDPQGLN